MRTAHILYKNEKTGILTQQDNGTYIFKYDENWLTDNLKPAISLTLPKEKKEFHSEHLMPFFYNILPEGTNKKTICTDLKIDEKDYFSLLCASTKQDSIGAVSVEEVFVIR